MGLRAYVARSGWRDTPITADEWHDAVLALPELEVRHVHGEGPVRAMLRGSTRRGLSWDDGYISGHHVNARLIAVMFVLAERLGGRVYSAHRRPYLDVADWEQRVERYRRDPAEKAHPAAARTGRSTVRTTMRQAAAAGRDPFFLLFILLVIAVGWALLV